jgi:glycosyltransferase involved in cell wall biosynthesis
MINKGIQVSIIMATYNRAHLILETLVSIQKQTYQNWECIIVDDYSADNTKEVIDEFIRKDNRFCYFLKTKNYKKGLSGTRNQGLDIAAARNAEYIQLFDDDDIMHPQKLELQIQPLLDNEILSFSTCKYKHYHPEEDNNFQFLDNDCNIESKNLFLDFYNSKIRLNSLGPLWRSTVFLKYRFDEDLLFSEERDLYLKIFLKERPKFFPINQVLFYYRKHSLTNTGNRYDNRIKSLSKIKSQLNLYDFILNNKLWDFMTLKIMINYFIFNNFNLKIASDLLRNDLLKSGFREKVTRLFLKIYIKQSFYLKILINKLLLNDKKYK